MACIAVIVLIPIMIKFAPRLKLLDTPTERKNHEGQIPLIGGVVIMPVFMIVTIIAGFSIQTYWSLYSAIIVLLITGAVDDKTHLHPWVKFALQAFAASLIVFFGDAQIDSLGNLFGLGEFTLGFMTIPFSFAAVMLLINAVNLMDGLDGLAAGSVLIMLALLTINTPQAPLAFILIAALAGFLFYNLRTPFRKKASIFLGDAGSLCLGLCLA